MTTYELIETVEVGAGGASEMVFTNIPTDGTYTDLKLVVSGRTTGATYTDILFEFNGVNANKSYRQLYGTGSGVGSDSNSTQMRMGQINGVDSTSNVFTSAELYIPNYAGSNFKSSSADSVAENNATTAPQALVASLWSNTAAVNQIKLTTGNASNFVQGSRASLYGIKKLEIPAALATGGSAVYSFGYWYHTFTSSGTFTPTVPLDAEVLLVAGGGGGAQGGAYNGGGGAGGVYATTVQSLTPGNYAITVGAGGGVYANGSNSSFAALSPAIGGGRGGNQFQTGADGGSGGGAGGNGEYAGGAGTPGQGNNGGYAVGSGGGGGGGGGAGTVPSGTNGGNGTAAFSAWLGATSTGVNGYIGGGGGGNWRYSGSGNGGLGGGGRGVTYTSPYDSTPGTTNTGGGGGAGQSGGYGAAGGSGLVIVRYAA